MPSGSKVSIAFQNSLINPGSAKTYGQIKIQTFTKANYLIDQVSGLTFSILTPTPFLSTELKDRSSFVNSQSGVTYTFSLQVSQIHLAGYLLFIEFPAEIEI